MNRLTRRNEAGIAYYPHCFEWPCGGSKCTPINCDFDDKVCERLAAYEDTWMEPEEITALKRERDAEVPCKIGDMVWAIRSYKGYEHPQMGVVSGMYFLPDMTLQIVVKHIARGKFGKTVFLTEADALDVIKEDSK